jgi:hypothetical protein
MLRIPRRIVVLSISVVCAAATLLVLISTKSDTAELAFWFERISENARMTLPGEFHTGISADEMAVIEAISRDEIVHAFQHYPIKVVGRTSAAYHVRVIDSLNSSRGPAESYMFPGIGGQGYINFRSLAYSGVILAPPGTSRDEIVAAIGRGIGRAAVHEFTHQLLGPGAPIDESKDMHSYEYGSNNRREQYYGEMRWDIAAPMLREKFHMD